MIRKVKLRSGATSDSQPAEFEATPVTIFVGPNNSGKTLVLNEITAFCREGRDAQNFRVFKTATFVEPPPDQAEEQLAAATLQPLPGAPVSEDAIYVGKGDRRHHVNTKQLLDALHAPNRHVQTFCQYYLSFNTLALHGAARMNLVRDQPSGDLQQPAQNTLQVLFRDDSQRRRVRKIVHEAFGLYFVIDPTGLSQLRIKLSKRAPHSDEAERSLAQGAIDFFKEAQPIANFSDGVKAFAGIIMEALAGDPNVLLIDEPEAFLHPSLSHKLGVEVSKIASERHKRLFASTHSSAFLMGCIQSGVEVTIVRLTYQSGVATARILRSNVIRRLMRNPLLRSTRVLNGLFYDWVVVTESDADRAFYEEINERLLTCTPDRGLANCLFISAQNKQTVHTIVRPLRDAGIPAAAIVDVDVIKEGGDAWTNFLKAAKIPETTISGMRTTRKAVMSAFERANKDMKKNGGVDLLNKQDRESANNLFDQLEEYGLFIVRRGELESWLPCLGVTGHGPKWVISVFEKMGEDPDAKSYMRPSTGDVWEFLGRIKAWLTNPERKGIPA